MARVFGLHHGEHGARIYNGGPGQSPQQGPGTEPPAGGQETKPPEVEHPFTLPQPEDSA